MEYVAASPVNIQSSKGHPNHWMYPKNNWLMLIRSDFQAIFCPLEVLFMTSHLPRHRCRSLRLHFHTIHQRWRRGFLRRSRVCAGQGCQESLGRSISVIWGKVYRFHRRFSTDVKKRIVRRKLRNHVLLLSTLGIGWRNISPFLRHTEFLEDGISDVQWQSQEHPSTLDSWKLVLVTSFFPGAQESRLDCTLPCEINPDWNLFRTNKPSKFLSKKYVEK